MKRSWLSPLAIVAILVLAALGVWFILHGGTANAPISSPSPSPTTSASALPTTYPISVFFSRHPDSDNDPSKVFAVARTAPDAGVGTYAIAQLIAGPTASEANYFTQVSLLAGSSTCGGKDFNLTISSGTATLTFCKSFNAKGVVSDAQAQSEITTTLKQFSTVSKVVILNTNGDCLFDAKGDNGCKQ